MTHSAILSDVYSNFSRYRTLWRQNHAAAEELGALVFLPGRDLNWEWWSMLEIREYIRQGGLDDRELLGGLNNFDSSEEFLVLVIEHVDGPGKQSAHLHRMNKAKLN